jgi:toxin ParE1/3/4
VRRGHWTVRLSDTAETDYDEILRWSASRFGNAQAISYGNLIAAMLARLERGPNIAAVRRRDEIGAGLHTLHVGRRGRHIILFRISSELELTIDVLRILYEAMDLARHVQPDE